MSLDVTAFYDLMLKHFRKRQSVVRELAVMAAIERWIQFEAAGVLATRAGRARCGLEGGPRKRPTWWVTCEYNSADLWIAPDTDEQQDAGSCAIEFKAVHNNKNFRKKIHEIRRDLTKLDAHPKIRTWSVVLAIYAQYATGARYQPLRTCTRGPVVEPDDYWAGFGTALRSKHAFYGGLPTRRVMRNEEVSSLTGSPYTTHSKASCRLLLVA